MRDHITARRAALAADKDRAELDYARIEAQITQLQQQLAGLGRAIDAMHGGLVELDAMLVADAIDAAEEE